MISKRADLLRVGANGIPAGLWLARGQAGTGHTTGTGQVITAADDIAHKIRIPGTWLPGQDELANGSGRVARLECPEGIQDPDPGYERSVVRVRAIAAVLQGAIPGRRIGVILSGGNVDAARLAGRL